MGQWPGQGLQRQPEGIQGRAGVQGHLPRILCCRHSRLPRRQRAAHPAGVRGRHRQHDGQQGRHHPGDRGDEDRRREVRPQRLRAGRGRLLHRAQRPDAEPAVQQLDDGVPLQQGRVQGGRPGPGKTADHLARSGAGRGQAQDQRSQVPVHHQLAELDATRELLSLAQRGVCNQAQRLQRPGHAPGHRHPAACAPHREPGQHGAAGPVRLQGAQQLGRRHLCFGRMRDDDRIVGAVRRGQAQRQVPGRHRHPALLPRRGRRAAEHRHRRRQPVGHVRQEAGRSQGRGAVLQVSVRPAGAGQEPPGNRLPADHASRPTRSPRRRASTSRTPAPTSASTR